MSDNEMKNEIDQERRGRSRSPINRRSRSRSRSPRRSRNDRPPRPFQGGRRIVLRNIPYELRWQELKDMFRKEIGDVTYVEMLETPEGKSKGVAVVEFRDSDHAKRAIEEFHQKKLNDRAIIVREERDKDRQEFIQHQKMRDNGGAGVMGPGGLGGAGMGGVGGVSPQILSQLGIEGPISSTVFVANLDYKVTWWKLKDVFKLAGNVVKAEIKEDKNGKSRGMGVVTFETPLEAVQAVSMFNGQVLYDRNMIVRVDKVAEADNKPKLPSGLKSIGMGLGTGGAPISNINQLAGLAGGMGGSAGLLGMGGLSGLGGGNSGLGLLGAGGGDLGGGFGGNLGLAGLGGSGSLGSLGSLGNSGMGGDMGLGASQKMGGMDSYSGMGLSSLNGNGSLSGLGGLGPSLSSLSSGGLGVLGAGGADRMGDRLGLSDSLGRDRMGGMDRMSSMSDRMMGMDRMSGLDSMRDSYGSGRDMRDDGGRRTTRPDNCTVIVKNLPYSTNWQSLKEHFRDAGDVKFAEIVMEKGRSTGVGYVRFSNYEDAHRAINQKHRSRLEKRNIDVSLHRN